MKSVAVLGKGTLAVRIAAWFHSSSDYELVAVVPVVPEPTWTDSLSDWARNADVPVLESAAADLGVSVFYERILGREDIRRFGRLLNLHNGPLPRYRGVSPINWALKNSERMHGVTIHEITEGIDDGPIVAQATYSIYPEFDEVIDVYERSLQFGWTLFQATIPLLDRIIATPQDETQATYYSKRENYLLGERRYFTKAAQEPSENSRLRHIG